MELRQYTAHYTVWDWWDGRLITGDPIRYYSSDDEARERMQEEMNASYPPPQYEIESFRLHFIGTGDPEDTSEIREIPVSLPRCN